ncbi:hypothetical protein QTJ16_004039 [Diplocarpon rosae]|uniref:Dopa 4,5-dioxygenase n=1 Tax=Diplocarpon rosae TaxID=946125 RepID=A0AAD9T181_9HELO|nr:hypothetical protein QTJ16_004039 [Diplocarpon rosae]
MADPSLYWYESPLQGYENAPPLSDEKAEDGKSLKNTQTGILIPELRIYRFWEHPVGPHPVAMFEVDLLTPAQFGAFIPWLVINRGPLSALLHPNTVSENGEHREEYRDHTQRATWLGQPVMLDLGMFREREKRMIGERNAGLGGERDAS